ncbi:DUF4236 domain-containing protein [Streptomyces sp.]|uniref:DUF4236 domain-containing protein n=1 Tax=Streptomyces sp. TaxID=1931 RepID=UPI002F411E1D
MPLTFRKSIKIAPGVRINIGKKSRSITVGPKWLKRTWSSTGRTTTSSDLPGPFGWRSTRTRRPRNR